VRRKTIRKRMGAKLRELKQQLRERMHDPLRQTGQRLIVQGHFTYHAVPGNIDKSQLIPGSVNWVLVAYTLPPKSETPALLDTYARFG
jgi:hypothetical protein